MLRLVLLAVLVGVISSAPPQENADANPHSLTAARNLLARIDKEYGDWNNRVVLAEWEYASDLTEAHLTNKINVASRAAAYNKQMWQEINAFPWRDIEDYNVRRQFSQLAVLGTSALPEKDYEEYEKIVSDMEGIYSKAKICAYNNTDKCDLALEPDLTELLVNSRDPEELKHAWVEWRKASGEKVKQHFSRYVELSNLAARLNNFTDTAAYWLKDYEDETFEQQIESLWQQLKPLYLQLHAYVRGQLRRKYGENVISKDGPIPAHLLGNMWSQSWSNIADFTIPHPGKKLPDVSKNMVDQGYDAQRIFRLAEDFFKSLNLSRMPDSFWEKSILVKPADRELICHASAWDFFDGKDFRIKQCTRVNMEDLLTAHHEMGHIQYFLQYKHQPAIFKQGANPGFHEAIGDVMSLSASTLSHLKKVGLLDNDGEDPEASLNNLYVMGLDKITFLPFAYMMDSWRWNVFRGTTKPDQYNCKWWSLVEELQGIEPPVDRTEVDFDPGSKYHIIANVEYIRYYVSFIIQFQFHKALCVKAGQYDPSNSTARPLHQCDIYQSKEAGNLLASMLQMGSSRPWQDAMEKVTGQRAMDANGLLEYFRPLSLWLEAENKRTGEYIGWKPSSKQCVQNRTQVPGEAAPSSE